MKNPIFLLVSILFITSYSKETLESQNALDVDLKHGDAEAQYYSAPIYLDDNGITIKCYDWANIGDMGEINGISYTVVDETLLREMIRQSADLTKVCTTRVTDMSNLPFPSSFTQDIGNWDVSNVTNMSYMFGNYNYFEQKFNQDIGNWDVSSVTTMDNMFFYAGSFNQHICKWDVSNVTDMSGMFGYARLFNEDIGEWDVSSVTDMSNMFYYTSSFNQNIGKWDVSSVTDMSWMFFISQSFDQNIGDWDVSSVTNMQVMFSGSISFNQDLQNWVVDNVDSCWHFSNDTSQWTLPKPNLKNCQS